MTFYAILGRILCYFIPYALIEEMISNTTLRLRRKKWIFKHLSMFLLQDKQYKQHMKFFALLGNSMLFYNFNVKSGNAFFIFYTEGLV